MASKHPYSLSRMGITTTLFLGALLFILLMGSATPFGIAASSSGTNTDQSVSIETVQYQDSYQYQRYFIGQVEARQTSPIGFEIGGMIKALPYDEGDSVEANAVLAELDTARLDARKNEAEAGLARAKADAQLAASTYRRVADASQANAVSAQEKDEAREARDAMEAAKAVAEARLDSIKIDIMKSKLLAPFAGHVVKRRADEGVVVVPGQAILEIQQNSNYDIRVGVTSAVATTMEKDSNAELSINGKSYPAKVKAIMPLRSSARTIDVIFALEKADDNIRAGDIARLPVSYPVQKRGFWVPFTALKEGKRGLWSLYVLKQQGETQTAERRTVEIHYIDNARAFVSGAVDAGEALITEGASKLVPGQGIRLARAASNDQ